MILQPIREERAGRATSGWPIFVNYRGLSDWSSRGSAMNGRHFAWNRVRKNRKTGMFEEVGELTEA